MPRQRIIDPSEYPQDPQPKFSDAGDGTFEHEGIEIVQDFTMGEAERAAFMEEKVVIRVQKPNGYRPDVVLTPSVNGRFQGVHFNIPQVVARKFVEALARAHETHYEQDEEGGMESFTRAPRAATTQSYMFEIIQDTPQGLAWYNKLIRQQAL